MAATRGDVLGTTEVGRGRGRAERGAASLLFPPGDQRPIMQTRSTAVTRFNATIALTLVMGTASLLVVGCQSTKKDVPVSTSVTDVTATPAPVAQPAYTPAPNPAPTPAYASVSDSITPPS